MPRSRARARGAPALALFACLSALCATGCVTRPVRHVVYDDGDTTVSLRSDKRGFTDVEKGFDHPATIAPVRMAHILSRIDLRDDEGERRAAVPLETLYEIAEQVSRALTEAKPHQEIVVQSVRRAKRLGIFDRRYLTSLLVYMRHDVLYVHISRSDWEIPDRRRERLPETQAGEHPLSFRLLVDKGMSLVDTQGVAVQWRDEVFRKPTRTRVTSTGKVVRRTILLESLEDDTEFEDVPKVSDELSPEQLRALADLEEARQAGEVTEAEYAQRRRQILIGVPTP